MTLNYGIYGSRHRNQGGSTDRNDWLRHYGIFNITKDTEIINFYNNLDQYAKDKIDRQLIDLTNAKKESRNYCIKVCPKCGAVNPRFTKSGNANSGKPMLKCSCCHKRFTYDNGQLTHYSHQDESKWDQLIVDTFSQVPVEKSATNMNISTYTVWRM